MAVRQNTQPVAYDMTRRPDNVSVFTTTKAGVVCPVTYAPLLRGDSASGRVQMNLQLAEMPRPVNNAILARAQAWFVPRPAMPYFYGVEDFVRSYEGITGTRMGGGVAPSDLYRSFAQSTFPINGEQIHDKLGLVPRGDTTEANVDIHDAYSLIWNFRRDAHSSKIERAAYITETLDSHRSTSTGLLPAFWPTNRMMSIKPDYETALVTGSLELDVSAGSIPVSGLGLDTTPGTAISRGLRETGGTTRTATVFSHEEAATSIQIEEDGANSGFPAIYAEMAGQPVTTIFADIDKARTTNAFAKMQAMMAGSDFSGYNTDDAIVSSLMQGYSVPEGMLNRPMLLDSKTVVFGSVERHATDAANLDDSVTTGSASVSLSINIPKAEYGGIMMTTVEVMPERLYERQLDPYYEVTTVDDVPNALRDIQKIEPVDIVTNARVDSKHGTPEGVFGYEPMNNKWRREFTRLGGEFQQRVPGTPDASQRTAIWQVDIVDPALTADHWLCPSPFPQDVFSVPANDACEIAARQVLTITGITQFGDELVEDNGEFVDVNAANP